MNLLIKQPHRIILILILVVILIKGFYLEKILGNNGFGWGDGNTYANCTINVEKSLREHTIDKYLFHRIVVPFILHYTFIVFNFTFSNSNIITAYCFANIIFILISVVYFFRISTLLKLIKPVEIIGFSSLFFCFPVLKLSMYYPILMDIPAFALSIILIYYFLKENYFLFFLIILIGSFVFPTFVLLSCLLFFKKRGSLLVENTPSKTRLLSKWRLFLSKINVCHFLFCFTIPFLLLYVFFWGCLGSSFESIALGFKFTFSKTLLMWVSFAIALLYLAYSTYFPKSTFSFKKLFTSINYLGVLFGLVVVVIVQYVINKYAADTSGALTFSGYLKNVILQATKNPFNFMVAHVFYFGLAPLLFMFLLRDIKKEIILFGFGMILFFNVVAFFSVGSESRQLINYYPIFILLLLLTLNKYWNISLLFSVIYSVICLGLSHFWYNINTGMKMVDILNENSFSNFPMQRYFMFQGPWVSNYMYKMHLLVFLFLFVLLWIVLKKTTLITRKKEIEA